jgi:Cu/Ag efflux pump CusA
VLSLTEVIRYGADAPQVVRRLHGMLDELESTLPAERQAAIADQRSLLKAAVSAALPAPFAPVASVADRAGLG